MLRMTAHRYEEFSTSHTVYFGDKLLGTLSVFVFNGSHYKHRDVTACYVGDMYTRQFETITDAIRWMVIKEVMHDV